MSIIVQAGHHSSNSSQLMQMLYERGLSEPHNSYTHKLNYRQVTDTIDKILSRGINSTANSKLADNIMVDFLLANIDSENWGWESEKNLSTLQYWQQLEPDVRFILVFDHPNNILNNIQATQISVELVDELMIEWIDYHQKMLDMVDNYNEKSILVEGISTLENIVNLNQQVSNLAQTLKLKSGWQVKSSSSLKIRKPLSEYNEVEELIVQEILYKYPEAIRIFNELLNKASMKTSSPIYKNKDNKLEKLINSFNLIKSAEDLRKYQLENEHLTSEFSKLQKNQEELISTLDYQKLKAESEKKMLTRELYEAQNTLEEYTLEADQNKKQLQRVEEKLAEERHKNNEVQKLLNEKKKEIEGLNLNNDKEKNKISNNIESSNLDNQINSITKKSELQNRHHDYTYENELLHSHLHKVQEELEKYYLENQELKKFKDKLQTEPPKEIYYGAIDRVKQDLPYRLGSTMVKRSKNPKDFATMPLALVKEYRDFKSNLKNQQLPDLELYRDKHEAEKVKKHLSYRLGSLITEKTSSPKTAVTLPFLLMKEVRKFKK